MKIAKNQLYEIEITSMTNEGNGVGRIDDIAVFVPQTAVGDRCIVKIVKVLKNYCFAKVEEIIVASIDRIEPDCDVFSKCGGCSYRHISYESELRIKEDIVKNAFLRIGKIDTKVEPIIGSERQIGYRNKAQFPVGKDLNGNVISGFYSKRSHRIVSADNCLLQDDVFSNIKNDIIAFIKEKNISVYDETANKGLIRHIYIRRAEKTNEIMVCLVISERKFAYKDEFINMLLLRYPDITSIVLNINTQNTNVILGKEYKTIYGKDYITDIVCGVKIRISAASFYQVNRDQAEILYTTAINLAKFDSDDTLIDLYCGTGIIGLVCANKVKKLIGVEIIPQAIENAKENAKINNIDNAEFLCSDAGQAAKYLAENKVSPDVIILDPPRKGIDQNVIDAIEKMSPKRVVMISCNPATAARDCGLLKEKGYETLKIIPVDMFPRTTHVETVVLLSREKANDYIRISVHTKDLLKSRTDSKDIMG